MSRDLRVGMAIEAEDRGATQRVRQVNRAIERETKRTADATKRQSDQGAQAQERAARRSTTAAQRMYLDRERLGIRSEQRIQREIALTEAAYNRLARTGRLSSNELARASQSAQQRMQSLRREMETVQAIQRVQGPIGRGLGIAHRGLQLYQGVAGAVAATGYAMAQPVTRSMGFDQRIAAMANTAYAGDSREAWQAGRAQMAEAVKGAVSQYGGSRDDATDALDAMIASGAMGKTNQESRESSMALLGTIQKAVTANPGASSVDMANLAIQMKQFGFKDEDVSLGFDIAARAGQLGGFELRDMARWLPQQLAAARALGMSGPDDFASVVAINQASRKTAGTADEAGNNVVNYLQKLSSKELATNLEKIEVAPGQSIDLVKTFTAAREKGINPLDAFGQVLDKVMVGNKGYAVLQERLRTAGSDDERRAIWDSQASILQGSVIGQMFQDRQAWTAVLGVANNRDYIRDTTREARAGQGANDEGFARMSSLDGFKSQRAKNAALFAESEGMTGVNNIIGSAAESFAGMAEEYPKFTAGLVTATQALNALALAAGAVAAIGFVNGRGRAGKQIIDRATNAATAGAGAAAASRAASKIGGGKAALGVAGAVAAVEAGQVLLSDAPAGEQAQELTGVAGGAVGMFGGAKAGAAAGVMTGPAAPFMAPLLSAVGGALGYFLGDELGNALGKGFFGEQPEPAPLGPDDETGAAFVAPRTRFRQKQEVEVKVTVENGDITASVVDRIARESRRH